MRLRRNVPTLPADLRALLSALGVVAAGCGADAHTGDVDLTRYAARVVSFEPGDDAGFGASELPDVVLGPPRGGGERTGSLDVVALGHGGEITLELGGDMVDGPGPDLLVFENAFFYGEDLIFAEPAWVSVSEDGVTFEEFPCEPEPTSLKGCAGVTPVYADGDAGDASPFDPKVAGGDAFDLADVGLARARFVRIRDSGVGPGEAPSAGFDLDAVSVVHAAPAGE